MSDSAQRGPFCFSPFAAHPSESSLSLPLSKTQHLAFFGPRFFGLLFGGLSMLLTVLWLVGSLLNTLLLVQGGVDQGVPVRGAENWQPDQELSLIHI